MTVWVMVVYALAVARLTGLIVQDTIMVGPLVAVHKKLGITSRAGRWFHDLVTCPWCMSMWVGAVVVPVAWFWGERLWLLLPAMVLAVSQLTGMVSRLGRG